MNKFFKKPMTLILSCAIVLSMFVPVNGAVATSDYESHWANKSIQTAIDTGMVKGYPDGTFKPDNAITRSEFFSLVNNAFKFTVESEDTFTDVVSTKWYAPVIAKAKAAGYIVGYPDGSIHPEMKITRQEAAVIISRLEELIPLANTMAYTDATVVAEWSKQAVIALYEAEIMIGYPDGSFKPENQITRAEAVVVLNRSLNHNVASQETDVVVIDTVPVNQDSMTLILGGETAAIAFENATNADIIWTSSDTDVATVVDGIVTPVGLGTVTITGSSSVDETILTTTVVTVNEVDDAVVIPVVIPVGTPVDLGTAGDYVILSKTGISAVPNVAITGNIGVSPIDATAITGFSLTMDASNLFSISSQITGKAFAADYTSPTSSNLTTAVSNMETAYTDAAGRAADYIELHSGDLSGKTLTPGVYKWGTGVLINADVTLSGGPDDVFIFQIAEGITQANGTSIILADGVQAKNIFWQTAESVTIGTGSHFEGIILSMTNITMGTNSSINGRLFAQTAVTLDQATVVQP